MAGLVWCSAALAQSDEIDSEFQVLDASRAQQLRSKLDEPIPQDLPAKQLIAQYWERDAAAQMLGDMRKREALLREAISLLPEPSFKRNLGQVVNLDGRFEEGNALLRQAIKDGNGPEAAFSTATLVCELFRQNKDDEARATAREADHRIATIKARVREAPAQIKLYRAAARRDNCMSMLEERIGHYGQAIEFAKSGEQWARMALPLYAQAPNASMQSGIVSDVTAMLDRKLNAYIAADRLADAETALHEYLRFSKEYQLPAHFLSQINSDASNLRFSQREFAQAEHFSRKSDEVLAGMGMAPLSRQRINVMRMLLSAQIGQKKWPEALALLNAVDAQIANNTELQQRTRFPLNRGLVYLHTQRYAGAARLFENAAAQSRKLNGDNHFLTAQNVGLQGAALWRSGVAENQARALPLLKAAVRDYMAPANADFSETIGLRHEIRVLVFDAYLDAASRASTEDAIAALGPADWSRGGVVKDALNDAAVRAAASTPAMADVVRREQDARNEITGLRRYLAGELGDSDSPLPQVAAQMRERIAVLERQRSALQAEVKAKFPEYDRLIHPDAPTAKDIARQLNPEQALVLLLPAADTVYVWAIANDRPARFVRSSLNSAAVSDMVKKLRAQLDFGAAWDAGKRFDSATAFALYQQLLAPVDEVLLGKTQLVVAAGGALSQLPFAVLQTQAGAGLDATAPWLIQRSNITQVPSLAGWLAIKSLAARRAAPEAFAGWGDPVFDAKAPANLASLATNSTRKVLLTRAKTQSDSDNAADTASELPPAMDYARIPTLPETRDELLAIAATLKSDPGKDLMLGTQATRDSVLKASADGLLAQKRVIAFATHGLMAGDLPRLTQPALALAATGKEQQEPLSPLLTLEDVLTLKLNADWVVLSACNSAAEDGRGDEAMSGLARGFFYAGSRALLVTHWAVESESAKLLTTATFAHYTANPKAPKAESLRQAMLQVMAMPAYRHPAFWAPYALVGDGGR